MTAAGRTSLTVVLGLGLALPGGALRVVLGAPATPATPAGAAAVAAQQSPPAATANAPIDPELEAEVRELASLLRCPVCRGLSVYDSPSPMAQQMRALIRDKLRAGQTREQVTAYFVERYGEWILLEPKAEGFNWVVWILPVAAVVGGLLFVYLTARRWVDRGRAREASLLGEGGGAGEA